MDMGIGASERGHQTTYTARRLNFFKVFLVTWCRGKGVFPHKSCAGGNYARNAALGGWPIRMLYMSAPAPGGG